jgi:hypothetical protein
MQTSDTYEIGAETAIHILVLKERAHLCIPRRRQGVVLRIEQNERSGNAVMDEALRCQHAGADKGVHC